MPEVRIRPSRQVSFAEIALLSGQTADFMVKNKIRIIGIEMPDFLSWLNGKMSSVFFAEMTPSSWDHLERDGQTWIIVCSNDVDIEVIHDAVKSKTVF